jgi:hypothetical protein
MKMQSRLTYIFAAVGLVALAVGCAPQSTVDAVDGGADAIAKPDIEVADAYVPTLDSGESAYQITAHTLLAENARAPSVTTDSYGNLHVAYLCNCDETAAGNSAFVACNRICYAMVDCTGVHEVVGPENGIEGPTAWGNYVGTKIRLDEKDNVFVLKNISGKQVFHHQVEPNSVHRFDKATQRFVKIEDSLETVAILPHEGKVYLLTKRQHSEDIQNGVYLKVIDYDGNEVKAETLLAQTAPTAYLFVGGVVLDKNRKMHVVFRIDDCTDGQISDMKEIVYDIDTNSLVTHPTRTVTNARIGDGNNIAVGGRDNDMLAATAPVAWSQGLFVTMRRLSENSWSRRPNEERAPRYFTEDPRVVWLATRHRTVDTFNPEIAVDKLNRTFVAFGGVGEDDTAGAKEDVAVCHYHGPCNCTEHPTWCSHSINAYYFIVYENGAVEPLQLLRSDSTHENFQGYGEATVEMVPAWDQGVFAVYEHLEHFDGGSFNVYITPLGGAATACGVPIVE